MNHEIPESWAATTIDAVVKNTTQRVPAGAEKFLYIDISSINRATKQIVSPQYLLGKDAPSRARKVVQTGDILVSMTRPNMNAVALVPESLNNQVASTGFDVLRANEIDTRWLFYLVRTYDFVSAMSEKVQGALYPAISSKVVREYEIPLAPLNEQKRIADKLDILLTAIDAYRTRLDKIPTLIKRFRQSILAAATSGALTDEPDGNVYKKIHVGALLSDIRYGTSKKCHYEPSATPVIRIPNICEGSVSHSDLKFASFDEAEKQALALISGDILIIRSNGSIDLVGRTALITKVDEGLLYAGYLIRLRVDHKKVNPAYLSLALSAPDVRAVIELTARSTSGVNNINTEEIRALEISMPSLKKQNEVVRRVEALFSVADKLEAGLASARKRVDQLTPSILAQAFRGDLLDQDPSDEPASALLARIAAARVKVKVGSR